MTRTKKKVCSRCGGRGHNIRSCRAPLQENHDRSSLSPPPKITRQDGERFNSPTEQETRPIECHDDLTTLPTPPRLVERIQAMEVDDQPPFLVCDPVNRMPLDSPALAANIPDSRTTGRVWGTSVATINGLRIVDNLGAGNCGFLAFRDGLNAVGIPPPTVGELRTRVSVELLRDREVYIPHFEAPSTEALQRDPTMARSFVEFAHLTRRGTEWAQFPTFLALAALFPVSIRIWDDRCRGYLTVGTKPTVVNLLYLSGEPHYVALVPVIHRVPTLPSSPPRRPSISEPFESSQSSLSATSNQDSGSERSDEEELELPEAPAMPELSTECPPPKRTVRPPRPRLPKKLQGSRSTAVCDNCKRQSTKEFTLNIKERDTTVIGRKFGAIRFKSTIEKPDLCSECFIYFEKSGNPLFKKEWVNQWPSVIWTLLNVPQNGFPDLSTQVWACLPTKIREMWRGDRHPYSRPLFVDKTHEKYMFNALIETLDLGYLKEALEEVTSFFEVKCPLGCWQSLEACDEMPIHNFIQAFTGFPIARADPDLFRSARPDWPTAPPTDYYGYVIAPTMIISEKNGLALLHCKGHDNMKQSTIHIPRNPVAPLNQEQSCETLAPCSIVPKIVRASRMSKWSGSTHVIDAVGGYQGISSFQLTPAPRNMKISSEQIAVNKLILAHRPDIRSNMLNEGVEVEEMDELMRQLKVLNKKPGVFEESQSSGSYVSANDAFFQWKSTHTAEEKQVNCEMDTGVQPEKLWITIVHPADEFGCQPFLQDCGPTIVHKSRLVTEGRRGRHGPVFPWSPSSVVSFILIHCRQVYNLALMKAVEFRDKFTTSIVSSVASHSKFNVRTSAVLSKPRMDEAIIDVAKTSDGPLSQAQLIGKVLAALTEKVTVVESAMPTPARGMIPVDTPDDHLVVVVKPTATRERNSIVPTQVFCDRPLLLVLSSLPGDGATFRWSPSHKWWSVKGTRFKKEENRPALKSWQVAIYGTAKNDVLADEMIKRAVGGQTNYKCGLEDHEGFLVKQSRDTTKKCYHVDCERKVVYGCSFRTEMGHSCENGICARHYTSDVNTIGEAAVMLIPTGERVVEDEPFDEDDDDSEDEMLEEMSNSNTSSDDDDNPVDGENFNLGIYGHDEDDDRAPLHSRLDIPNVVQENALNVPSHVLLNETYGILKRGKRKYRSGRLQQFLHHFVTKTASPAQSMLFPAANILPSTYWTAPDDSPIGAAPQSLLGTLKCRSKYGPRSTADMIKIQLSDGDLVTSHQQTNIHLAFDMKLNLELNRNSSAMIYRRGLEHLAEKRSLHVKRQETGVPYSESDSSLKTRELGVLTKRYPWKYFQTITCNEARTPGTATFVKRMKIAAANIEEDYSMFQRGNEEGGFQDAYLRVYNSNATFINRLWCRFLRFFMDYLEKSPDQVAGPHRHSFARIEFQGQGAPGNKCHVHRGSSLWPEPIEESLRRVCCDAYSACTERFDTDKEALMAKGIVKHELDFVELVELNHILSTHNCSGSGERCMKRTNAEGEKICRVPKHPTSGIYWFEEKLDLHSQDILELLQSYGFARKVNDIHQGLERTRWIMDPRFIGGRHHYPTTSPPTYLPTIPMIQLFLAACFNNQVCDGGRFTNAYLLKYEAGKEVRPRIIVKGTKEKGTIRVETAEVEHEKISGQRLILNKLLQEQKVEGMCATEIGLFEMITYCLEEPYTWCTVNFVHVCTNPPEYRCWHVPVRSKKKTDSLSPGSRGNFHPPIDGRKMDAVPLWRRFTRNQERHAREYSASDYVHRYTEMFNIRPPELRCINKLALYHEIVVYHKKDSRGGTGLDPNNMPFERDPITTHLYDGCGHHVKLRRSGVEKLRTFLQTLPLEAEDGDDSANEEDAYGSSPTFLRTVLRRIDSEVGHQDKPVTKTFIDEKEEKEVLAVMSDVAPKHRLMFLYSVTLNLGAYETEFDLFDDAVGFRKPFQRAGLIHDADNPTEEEARALCRKFVDENCISLGLRKRQFEQYVRMSKDAIDSVLFGDQSFSSDVHCISEIAIKDKAEQEIVTLEQNRRENLVRSLLSALSAMEALPNFDQVVNAKLEDPVDWIPQLPTVLNQSDQSKSEQLKALEEGMTAIRSIINPNPNSHRHPHLCLVGPPGAGKTFLIQALGLFAASCGLKVNLTSLTSERSRVLGGIHLHQMFPIEVRKSTSASPDMRIAHIVKTLKRKDIKKMVLLQRMDVLIIEEIGVISAEMFVVLDTVMKVIMDNDQPFGGKLIIANGDHLQCAPVDGKPFWTSIHLGSTVRPMLLRHYVRSASDPGLQRVLDLMRQPTIRPEDISTILDILSTNCHFPTTWDDAPEHAMRVVSTRKAEEDVVHKYIEEKKRDPNVTVKSFLANDEVYDNVRGWKPAVGYVKNRIDKGSLEPRELHLFTGAVLRITHNKTHGSVQFSQGQLCIVVDIPQDSTSTDAIVRVRLVPPGVRNLSLIQYSWPVLTFKRRASPDILVGTGLMKGHRIQFPFRYYKANTIHRIMGETCEMVATEVNNRDFSKKHLRLWERPQLLVLLSRVKSLDSLHFVGPRQTTLGAFREMLSKTDLWTAHITRRFEVLCNTNLLDQFQSNEEFPYTFCSKETADFTAGVVYILISLEQPTISYVGQTHRSLKTRLREHNSGNGSKFTKNTALMPWAPLAYIYGFSEKLTKKEAELERLDVERRIHFHIRDGDLPETVLEKAQEAALEFSMTQAPLVVERLGKLRRQTGRGRVEFENLRYGVV